MKLGAAALNFSWLEKDVIAGCRGPRTEEDLKSLFSLGVRALVRLAPEEESGLRSADVALSGMLDCYEPVIDWNPPTQGQIDRVLRFINHASASALPVAVSCGFGYGRTGTVLACYIVSKGIAAEEAIKELIAARPCSGEILRVTGQKAAIQQFYARRNARNASLGGPGTV